MEQELTARMDDGHIVRVIEVAPPLPLPDPLPQYAIEHGERLVRHPDDIDHTLFLTALTRKEVRLLRGKGSSGTQ
jgi:hypothetical protein